MLGRHALALSNTATAGNERSAPLLERDRELGVLASTIARATEGSGSLLLVEGPAGIGKTRLLAETAQVADQRGCLVRHARGGEMERDMPFGVVRQLFEPLIERASEVDRDAWLSGSARRALTALGAFAPDTLETATDPFAAINGLYWLSANLASSQPVVLIIDDAQWSDSISLRFAAFLARRLADIPLCLILGVRTGEPRESPELQALRVESDSLGLQPLSLASVEALIKSWSGEVPSPGFAEACARASAGNPFLIIEILRELRTEARMLDDDAAASIEELLPANVARAMLFRLGRFGSDAIGLARAIAVMGHSPQLRYAAKLAGLKEQRARELSDHLRRAEILAPGVPIEFVHPLVKQAIYLEVPEGERSAAHRDAAELLASTGAPPDEIAAHLLACEPNGDEWVVERLAAAARAALADGAYDSAVKYLERALHEPPEDDLPILYLLGRALLETDVFRAPQVFADVAERAEDPELRVDALRRLINAYLASGALAAAANTCDEAIEVVGDIDREVLLDLEGERYFMIIASRGRYDEASDRIESVAAALPGATSGERVARQALAMDRFLRCAPIDEVVDLVLPSPELPWRIRDIELGVAIAAPKLLAWSGRWDDARREWNCWMEAAHSEGRVLMVSIGYSFLAEADRLAGRLHEAEAEARTAWEVTRLPGGFSPYTWSALMNLAATLLARGDVGEFRRLTEGFDLSIGPLEIPLNPWPLELRAQLRLEQGELELAVEDLLTLGDALERIRMLNPCLSAWRQDATEALAALGREREAVELISVAEERARAFAAPHAIASVLRARAMLEPRDRSMETLRSSIELFEVAGPSHELARSLIGLGSLLRRRGDRAEARATLERALDLAHRCGAGGVERRARDELAAAGARPRRAAQTGVGALTASELKVAALAAGGLTNKEIAERLFVTVRTVETHLTHVYEKLAIGGRRELGQALATDDG